MKPSARPAVFLALATMATPALAVEALVARNGTAVLMIEDAGTTTAPFTLSVGVIGGDTACVEGNVDCLTITGQAAGPGGGVYIFADPDNPGSGFTIRSNGSGYDITDVTGDFGAGSGNRAAIAAVAGSYSVETGAAAATYPVQDYNLVTPSGNIQCALVATDGSQLRCDMAELTATFTDRPADCPADWGSAFGLAAAGTPEVLCHGDTIMAASPVVLPYDQAIQFGAFTCSSAKTGLTCTNPEGHGFTLSKAVQTFF